MFASVKINRRETFGEGSFSIVYSGTYNGVQAAVKTFKANGKLTEEILKAIEKESIMSSKFRHQNIINFYGKGTDSSTGHPVLVFERLGMSILDALHASTPPSNTLRTKWLLGTADALEYLHQQRPPIVHRDLKPDNILIHPSDNRAVLADFGLTTIGSSHTTYSKKTESTNGHIFFAPPEATEQGYKPRTTYDVFSFGMTMYCILTRHWPFEGETMINSHEIVKNWIKGKLRPFRSGTPYYHRKADLVSDEAWDLIERCWSQGEHNRPPFSLIYSEIHSWTMSNPMPLAMNKPINSSLLSRLDFFPKKTPEQLVESGLESFNQKDFITAVKLFEDAANEGSADGQLLLAKSYYNGCGVEKDYSVAVMWFKKAAEQNLTDALRMLGVCYESGLGVSKENDTALSWYQKAAEKGDEEAKDKLSVCLIM